MSTEPLHPVRGLRFRLRGHDPGDDRIVTSVRGGLVYWNLAETVEFARETGRPPHSPWGLPVSEWQQAAVPAD